MLVTVAVVLLVVVCVGIALVAFTRRDRRLDDLTEEQRREERTLSRIDFDELERRHQADQARPQDLPPTHDRRD